MYVRTNESLGQADLQKMHPRRCRSCVFKIPGSYKEFEEAVRRWIATCVTSRTKVRGVPVRRERKLVTGNPSLVDIWNKILRYKVGQEIAIIAEYIWGPNRVESIRFSTTASPPPPPTQPIPPPPPRREHAKIGPARGPTTPLAEQECFGISCDAREYLKDNWGITPDERTVREAIKKEEAFLRRTRFRNEYKRILPEVLLYQPIDSWGEEYQKETLALNLQVTRLARERIFGLLCEHEPTFRLGRNVKDCVRVFVNSKFAR